HRQMGDLMRWARSSVQRSASQLCDGVVSNSRAAAYYLRARGALPEKQLAVIPTGLPETAFVQVNPALPRESGVVRIGMLACMNDLAKNHAAFVRVAALIVRKHPEAEFVLAGDGPLRAGLEEHVRSLGLGKR